MTNIDLPKPQIGGSGESTYSQINYTYNDTISVLLQRLEILADVAKAMKNKLCADDYLDMVKQADRDLIKVLLGDVENDSRDVRQWLKYIEKYEEEKMLKSAVEKIGKKIRKKIRKIKRMELKKEKKND